MSTTTVHQIRTERVRGFQPPWYSVTVYRCCTGPTIGIETRLRRSWRGPTPRGAIVANCGHQVDIA